MDTDAIDSTRADYFWRPATPITPRSDEIRDFVGFTRVLLVTLQAGQTPLQSHGGAALQVAISRSHWMQPPMYWRTNPSTLCANTTFWSDLATY